MHVAATRPDALDISSVSPESLEREKNVLTEQAKASGRPDNVIAKMVEGRVQKFYEEVALLEQVWVHDRQESGEGRCQERRRHRHRLRPLRIGRGHREAEGGLRRGGLEDGGHAAGSPGTPPEDQPAPRLRSGGCR